MNGCNGNMRGLSRLNNVIPLAILLIGIFVTFFNINELKKLQKEQIQHFKTTFSKGNENEDNEDVRPGPSFTIYGKHPDSGYLKHVINIFNRAGYLRVNYNSTNSWDVMWSHDYPFKKIKPLMKQLKPFQKVNKLPGSGYVTNKVNLATSGLPNIPKAFKIPNDTNQLLEYTKLNPETLFVQKNKNHRGIKIEKIENLDLNDSGSFVQEFVQDPFLIDGYKFDVGVYTMITSIDPLRIYVFDADVLLRFCPEKYHPFDPKNRDKYVVHDDYRPTWKVPTLSKYYSDLGYSFKETLNAYIRSIGKDSDTLWKDIEDIIVSVYKNKEKDFRKAISYYPETSKRMFFEMVRFDFFLDSNLKVYLMEANMSPNLSSAHFTLNRMLYEQVVYSLLRLVGVIRGGIHASSLQSTSSEELEMQVANKDLYVFSDECSSQACSTGDACEDVACRLCKRCLDDDELEFIRAAYLEHHNCHNCKRIFPSPFSYEDAKKWKEVQEWGEGQEQNNHKMHQWLYGKCLIDRSWCN
ncbi:probable tubulin polyglutamylase ttll-15 [Lepeophtheirus salmonis]|nr:probable tubulin polyglutamylase ttll-15 [Lepeophtheirus salmonis]XP_040571970.1 probable tubulin polyglutamylase ttll-15 [Lepeophtheirus salmonis]XP_040571971.1 probable tubulin polyglutamylase ttll-15 [Lepeophtheirus salmonis]XP_040571972.1 probable tubulin polyglutamylase ttll-15 [Lepeophtheirus salmonis]XP_040571973.1 probable tubulin polyglutamylase ttll-15 [Lepeophtheirus salmonis]